MQNQELLFELAKIYLEYEHSISAYIKNFGILDLKKLHELAKIAAKYDLLFSSYIGNYDIQDQELFIELLDICIENDQQISKGISNFGTLGDELMVKYAKKAATYDGSFPANVKHYKIKDRAILAELAEICVDHQIYGFSEYIQDFEIQDQKLFLKLIRKAATYDYAFSQYVPNFKISDLNILNELARSSFKVSFTPCLRDASNFQQSKEAIFDIILDAIAYDIEHLKTFLIHFKINLKELKKIHPIELTQLKAYIKKQSEEGRNQLKPWLQFIRLFFFDHESKVALELPEAIQREHKNLEKIYLATARLHHPKLRYKLALWGTQLFKTEEALIPYKEFLKASSHPLISILLCKLSKKFPDAKEQLMEIASHCRKKKSSLKGAALLISLLETLTLTYETSGKPLSFIVKALSQTNSQEIKQQLFAIQGIIQCKEIELFNKIDKSIQELYQLAFEKQIPLKKHDNFFANYMETIGKEPDSASLLVYAGRLKTINNEREKKALLDLLATFVESILDGTYTTLRYQENAHTKVLFNQHETLKTAWMMGATKNALIVESTTKDQEKSCELILKDTDDAWQMFMSGTRIQSCQKVNGDVKYNKCLISLPLDPKRRLITVEKNGELIGRAIMRLLVDPNDKPVLMLEKVYKETPLDIEPLIIEFAKERALSLGVPLYQAGDEPCELRSLYGPSYEYVDSFKAQPIQKEGIYTIPQAKLVIHQVNKILIKT